MPTEEANVTVAQNESMFATSVATGVREFRPNVDKWRNWQEVLDSHFVEAAIEEDRIKVSALLKAVGLEAYGLLRELCFPELPIKKSYSSLCEMLSQHYSPPVIIFRERRNFLDAKKKESESVAAWYARIKKLAMECKFGNQLQPFLLNKFITGFDGKIYERLCEEDESLTLEMAYKKALTMEAKMYAKENLESEIKNAVVGYEISLIHVPAVRDKNVKRLCKLASNGTGTRGIGSAALTLCYVAKGSFQCFHVEDLQPWDIAAGAVILTESGGFIAHTSGSQFNIMKPDLICAATKELLNEVKQLIDEADALTDFEFK